MGFDGCASRVRVLSSSCLNCLAVFVHDSGIATYQTLVT
jgi:hypothetical protein